MFLFGFPRNKSIDGTLCIESPQGIKSQKHPANFVLVPPQEYVTLLLFPLETASGFPENNSLFLFLQLAYEKISIPNGTSSEENGKHSYDNDEISD